MFWGSYFLRGGAGCTFVVGVLTVVLYVLIPMGGHGGVGWCIQYGWYPHRARAFFPQIGGGGSFLGILALFYIAFSAKFSAKSAACLNEAIFSFS